MSRRKIMNRIHDLERRRASLIDELLQTQDMVSGTFIRNPRKCGRANCRCAMSGSTGHPTRRFLWMEQGKRQSRSIPEDDVKWMERMTENNRIFRKNRVQLRALQRETNELLDQMAAELVEKTRQRKNYL